MTSPGVVFLGLAAGNPAVALALQSEGYEIWTLNDWYSVYPDLRPNKVFQLHKEGVAPHTDEFGTKRDATGVVERCRELGIPCVHNLKPHHYAYYYGKQPEAWYQCTMNYMFVDAWAAIGEGLLGDHIVLEGMPLTGTGERVKQRRGMVSAVDMSICRGIRVTAPHYDTWKSDPANVDWRADLQSTWAYALTEHDHEVYKNMVDCAIRHFNPR